MPEPVRDSSWPDGGQTCIHCKKTMSVGEEHELFVSAERCTRFRSTWIDIDGELHRITFVLEDGRKKAGQPPET